MKIFFEYFVQAIRERSNMLFQNWVSADSWWVFALLSAFFAALTTILAKVGVAGVDSTLATAIRTVVILAIAGLWVWVGGRWRELAGIAPRTLIFLALSGVATGLSWLCYFRALQLGQATAVTTVDKSGLVLVLVLSVLFLGEPLSWKVVLGMLLMLAGTLVVIL
jgi:bacterial/archaeal transporter family protein